MIYRSKIELSVLFIAFLSVISASRPSHLRSKSRERRLLSILYENKHNYLNDELNASTEYNLPDKIRPLEYYLRIFPSFEENDFKLFGQTIILFYVRKNTSEIVLNSVNLNFNTSTVKVHAMATADGLTDQIKVTDVKSVNTTEQVTIYLEKPLVANNEYNILINYSGIISESSLGFYRSWYMNDGEIHWIGATRLVPTNARMVFPCFDEPRYRTPFVMQIGRDGEMRTFANAHPFMSTVPVSAIGSQVWDLFLKTKPIPTHLLSFCVVGFKRVHKKNIHMWVQPNMQDQTEYILNNIMDIVSLLHVKTSLVFKPTSRINIVAIPDYVEDGVANLGLIYIREKDLLYEENFSLAVDKQNIFTTAVQKLAYYCFGNFVTQKWWTYYWLHEAMTKFFKYNITSLMHPSWRMMDQLVVVELQSALSDDISKHPLNKIISKPSEIEASLNTYLSKKGCALFRMIENFVGEKYFEEGIKKYLQFGMYHSKGVVTPETFWNALDGILPRSILPIGLNVKKIMDSWTNQRGYPLVTITRNFENDLVIVSQREFTEEDDKQNSTNHWWIPLTLTYGEDTTVNASKGVVWLQPNETYAFTLKTKTWVLFNVEQTGFYRVNYDQDNWDLLIDQLMRNHTVIHAINRAQLIDDAFALAEIGEITYNIPITLSRYLINETDLIPWYAAMKSYKKLLLRLHSQSCEYLTKALVQHLIRPYYHYLIDEMINQNHIDKLSVNNLLLFTSNINLDVCKKDLVYEFNNWIQNASYELIPESKEAVLCTGIRLNGIESWNHVWRYYLQSNVSSEKHQILSSLGCSLDADIINKYLNMLNYSEPPVDVRINDYKHVFHSIVSHPENVKVAVTFVINNYPLFTERTRMPVLRSFFESLGEKVVKEEDYNKLQEFYDHSKDELGELSITLENSLSIIKKRFDWTQSCIKELEEIAFAHVSEILPFELNEYYLSTDVPTVTSITTALASLNRTHYLLYIMVILTSILF